MAAEDEERLVVLLEARIRDLEKNMAKASGVTAKTYREMSLGSKRATDQMEQHMVRSTTRINQALATTSTKIGTFGKAMIGGLIGGVFAGGLAGLVGQIRAVADSVAEVGDQARMAGLSSKAFQEWKFVAQQARIPIDAITDGIKELQLRADEFAVTGKGPAAEAFARIGLTPQEVKERLKDPTELMLLIIERTRQMKDTAAGIRIFDELFGGSGGERMVALLEQGEGAIRDQIRAANELGIVMNDDVIKAAAEIDRRFNVIANTVGSSLRSAIVEAAGALMEFIGIFNGFEARRDSTLNESVSKLTDQVLETDSKLAELKAKRDRGELGAGDGGWLGIGESTVSEAIADLERTKEAAETEIGMINELLDARKKAREVTPPASTDGWKPTAYTPPPADTGKGGGRSRSASASATERERKAVQDLIQELQEELALVGKSDAEKRAAAVSRQAGAAATEEERQKIIGLNEALYQTEEANRRAKAASDFFADAAYNSISDLIPKINTGNEALDRFVNTLIEAVAQAALLGTGPLAGLGGGSGTSGGGLFGGLFKGLLSYDGGGSTGMGPRSGGVDGKGGFPAILHPRETIIDHTRPGSSTGTQNVHVTTDVRVGVSKDGNLKAYVEGTAARISQGHTSAAMRQMDKSLPGKISDAMERTG